MRERQIIEDVMIAINEIIRPVNICKKSLIKLSATEHYFFLILSSIPLQISLNVTMPTNFPEELTTGSNLILCL